MTRKTPRPGPEARAAFAARAHPGAPGEGGLEDPRHLGPGPEDPLSTGAPSVLPTGSAADDRAAPAPSGAGTAQGEPVGLVDPRDLMNGPDEPPRPGEPVVPPPQRPPNQPEYQPPARPMEEPISPIPPPASPPPPEPIPPPPQGRGRS